MTAATTPAFYITKGDTFLPLRANMDLTGWELVGRYRGWGQEGEGDSLTATVTDATAGELKVETASLDVAVYEVQVKATRGAEQVTFPDPDVGWYLLTVGEAI